jgi:hypothetical protein
MAAPIDDFCTCGHRGRFHEGRRLLCVMAACHTCKGFDLAPTKVEEEPTPTATLAPRYACLSMGDGTFQWVTKDGKPCAEG